MEKVMAIFRAGVPSSGVIGGPVSGWIMQTFAGRNGWTGWQWLFLLEGIPALLAGIVALFYLTDDIPHAKWLTEPEKQLLQDAVKAEAGAKEHPSIRDALAEPKAWLAAVPYAFFLIGLYGVSFWLPSLIKASGVKDPLDVGLLTAIPYAAGPIATIPTSHNPANKRD